MRASMRSIARSRAVSQRSRSQSPFVCSQCQRAALRSSSLTHQQRHASSNDKPSDDKAKQKLPLSERFRRRIWGTDNPPGQKDPYTRASPEELAELREKAEREEEEERRAEAEQRGPVRSRNWTANRDAEERQIEALQGQGEPQPFDLNEPVGQLQPKMDADSLQSVEPFRVPVGEELEASDYVPAETWDGLARIGGKETPAQRKKWEAENPYSPFIPSKEAPEAVRESLVHRALVEILTLKDAGLPLGNASYAPRNSGCEYDQAEVVAREDGYSLSYENEGIRQDILQSMVYNEARPPPEIEQIADRQTELDSAEPADIAGAPKDASWHQIRLDSDSALKFALLRRVMQLTGTRIRDPAIAAFSKVGDVVTNLKARPKPTTVYDILMAQPELQALSNVQVRPNRYTPISKDMEFGRHKVVLSELARRGLRMGGKDVKVETNVLEAEEEYADGAAEVRGRVKVAT